MVSFVRPVVFAAFLAFPALPALGQNPPAQPPRPRETLTFKVSRAASPIVVDGVLDEDTWRQAVNVPVAFEWAPGDNITPPVKTGCLLTYDAKNLYVAFRAQDPRSAEIRAHLMDRDDTNTLIQDDHVGLMIDTFNDERRAFQFRVNPLGVQADAIFSEQDGVEDFSWDMIWSAVGKVTDDGYVIEIALPLKQLRFQPGQAVQTWGFEAFRSWPRNVRHRLSSQRRDRNIACLLCQENKITGLEGLAQGSNLEFDPTGTFRRTEKPSTPADRSLSQESSKAEAGLTARWSITPNMTFNGAVNPDFSQVEADVAQLDINQRFALFYPEKRPFFLEGIDFFTTPMPTVFTRTVADPDFGAKLTGKQGGNAVGVFVTRDRLNNLTFPSNQGSDSTTIEQDVTTMVGRYRRDVGNGSTIGALYAGREGDGYHNRQAGIDAYWRLGPVDLIRAQFIRSDTQYPLATATAFGQRVGAFGGNAAHVEHQHFARHWITDVYFESYDATFRSDTGYIHRVDYRNIGGQAQRRWQSNVGSWFNVIDVGVRGWRSMDSSWTLTDQTIAAFVNYMGPYQTQFSFNMPTDIVVFGGVRCEYLRPNFVFGIKPNGDTNLQVTGRWGGGVDFANGRKATSALQIGPALEYRPVRRVSLALQHNLDQLSVQGGRLYRANLTQFKAVLHLNVRTFLRAILQYTDISRDPALYAFPVEAHTWTLFSQYLFSFKLNPQTVLFVGYSDNSAGAGVNSAAAIDLQRQNRTVFMKIGYAWAL